METFSTLLALCAGIHRWPVNSRHRGQWRGALMFSLICAWINVWINNREAGDLRRHCTHYDVNVMMNRLLHIHNKTKETRTLCIFLEIYAINPMRAHGPLARYLKLRVAHAPGMPGTFSQPPRVSDPDMHHGTCVTHVPWCMLGSLSSGFLEVGGGENFPSIPGACATHNFTKGPWTLLSDRSHSYHLAYWCQVKWWPFC